jgi:DNA-binding response OmpR family regulator
MNVPVLIVEDEGLIQLLLHETLAEAGFDVAAAGNGKDAFAMLDKEEADYRALITDVNLPGKITGWDIAKHAREVNDAFPVIYLTGASAHDWASKGVPNSILIPKPFAPAQIITAVSQLLNAASANFG